MPRGDGLVRLHERREAEPRRDEIARDAEAHYAGGEVGEIGASAKARTHRENLLVQPRAPAEHVDRSNRVAVWSAAIAEAKGTPKPFSKFGTEGDVVYLPVGGGGHIFLRRRDGYVDDRTAPDCPRPSRVRSSVSSADSNLPVNDSRRSA